MTSQNLSNEQQQSASKIQYHFLSNIKILQANTIKSIVFGDQVKNKFGIFRCFCAAIADSGTIIPRNSIPKFH